jgi:PAS domain S-box-containing protein
MTKLLIVDDDKQGLRVLQALLTSQGYEVITAIHGGQALEKARMEPPDLIISDILMPVMDGFTLCREWKKDKQLKHIPFIFYTATYTDPRDKGVALRLGVERFLLKPLEPQLFLKILEEVVAECHVTVRAAPPTPRQEEETAYFREYNEALVRRLEDKVMELEGAYEVVEREMVDRKRAEEALRESEKRLMEIVNFLPDATFAIDRMGAVTAWNRTMEDMTGVMAEDMLGKGNHEYALPFYGVRQPVLIDLVFGPNEQIQRQHRFVKREGDIILAEADVPLKGEMHVISAKARPLYNSQGAITGAIESMRDITERIDAEEALLASEQRYKQLLDSVTDYIFTTQISEGRPVATIHGQGCAAVTGYTSGEYDSNPFLWYDMVHPEDREVVTNHAKVAMRGGTADPLEHRIIHKNGTTRWVRNTMVPRYDRHGLLVACDGLVSDITERKRAEEALKMSEGKYRNIVENASEGIFQSTPDGRYLSANPALARMYGFSSPRELTESITDISRQIYLHLKDYDRLHDTLREGVPVDGYEVELRRKDGNRIWVSIAERAVCAPDGEVLYHEGAVVDITERKRLEAQILQSQRMEAIVQLAGGVAHDFNNFLSVIMGFSGMLRMKMDGDDPRLYYVNQISSASEKAAGVTQSLLAFSKKQVMELKPHKLNSLLKDMEKLLRRLLHEDIELVLDLPPKDTIIMADAAQIDQVLINLATRARQAMQHEGKLTIKAQQLELDSEFMRSHRLGEPGDYAMISVIDNGTGMDGPTKERIFEPFSAGPDTGLALSTVYGIIKQHNGYIEVSSEPDEGTAFFIYLPAMKKEPAEETKLSFKAGEGGAETILVAEDNADLRRLIRKVLSAGGYEVVEAIDGEDAFQRFIQQQSEINLLLLDVVMPKMSGKETFDRIRRTRSHIKVLFVSGYGGDVVIDKGVSADVSHYIAKPFEPNELLQKVRQILDERTEANRQ